MASRGRTSVDVGGPPLTDARAAFERVMTEQGIPGLAYGIVFGDRLQESGGLGTRALDRPIQTPSIDTPFRIASMTKSFTAAAVLLARDEGRLQLDDNVARYVPAVGRWRRVADEHPITIRALLTHGAGLPWDDPWADRQQAMTRRAFDDLLDGGITFSSTPDSHFEYSNLGYAILGRVIEAAFDAEYRTIATNRLLVPLGLTSTTFDPPVEGSDAAVGYVRLDGQPVVEPCEPYGAFAPMGGLFSTVTDVAAWVGGLSSAFPPRAEPEDGHPLRRASRRDMQVIQRTFEPSPIVFASDADLLPRVSGYGYGLIVEEDALVGRLVSHRGGYPGFGSYMTWHVPSGIGVVALANLTYADLRAACVNLLINRVEAHACVRSRDRPSPPFVASMRAVDELPTRRDAVSVRSLPASNIELNEPLNSRRQELGPLGESNESSAPPRINQTRIRGTWWRSSGSTLVRFDLALTPEAPPRIQTLDAKPVPDAHPELLAVAERIVDAMRDGSDFNEAGLGVAELKRLRGLGGRLGVVRLGSVLGGDGADTAIFGLISRVPARLTAQRSMDSVAIGIALAHPILRVIPRRTVQYQSGNGPCGHRRVTLRGSRDSGSE